MIISKKELRLLYESGAKLSKSRQTKVDAELKRKCKVPKCTTSIAWKSSSARFCDTHRGYGATLIRTYNRKKKATYDAKHGTGRKTVKREVTPKTTDYLKYDPTMPLAYEDYKEPLREVKDVRGKGYGYMGTVAFSLDKNYVQCHICGNLFKSLGGHLRNHKTTAVQYKKDYGLSMSTALLGESLRQKHQELVVSKGVLKGKGLPEHLKGYNEKFKSGELKRPSHTPSLEWRNKRGLCPDQVLEKILDLKEKLGKTPGLDDFSREYKGRYIGSIVYQHGSWSEAVKKLGLQTREELRRVSKDKLIADLQRFKEVHGRIPMTSDFNRGLLQNKATYIRKFGTLNDARVEAGMNAVFSAHFGSGGIIEITPEQWYKYKEGAFDPRSKTKSAIRARQRREMARQREML